MCGGVARTGLNILPNTTFGLSSLLLLSSCLFLVTVEAAILQSGLDNSTSSACNHMP